MIGAYVEILNYKNLNEVLIRGIVIQQKYNFVPQDCDDNGYAYGFSHFVMHDIIFCSEIGRNYFTFVHEHTCYEILESSAVRQTCCNHNNYRVTLLTKDSI